MSELSIKVTIAGRIYPITIKADEEESVRKAAAKVDKNLKHLQDNYAVKDKQDLLAMTALQMATKLNEIDVKKDASISSSEFKKLEEVIDSML